MSDADQSANVPQPIHAKTPAPTSCRMKKKDDAGFLEDLKDHIDEFINASMDEHKTCPKKTIEKVTCFSSFLGFTKHGDRLQTCASYDWLQMFGISKGGSKKLF